jgi:hypothetical protein
MSTPDKLEVVSVERIDGTEIIVEFSDSTLAVYRAAELAALRPQRQPADSGLEPALDPPLGTQDDEPGV